MIQFFSLAYLPRLTAQPRWRKQLPPPTISTTWHRGATHLTIRPHFLTTPCPRQSQRSVGARALTAAKHRQDAIHFVQKHVAQATKVRMPTRALLTITENFTGAFNRSPSSRLVRPTHRGCSFATSINAHRAYMRLFCHLSFPAK